MADLVELTKPRITLMVVVTAGIGLLLASGGRVPMAMVLHALVGTGLVAAGSAALNHVLERDIDALMRRTANRPLPAGRMDPDLALTFGVGLAVAGLVELTLGVNLLTAFLGAAALAGYVFVYTPLKENQPAGHRGRRRAGCHPTDDGVGRGDRESRPWSVGTLRHSFSVAAASLPGHCLDVS